MPKRHADSTQDENPPNRRQLSADEVLVEAARNGDTTAVRAALEKLPQDSETVVFDAVHETCRGNHDECLALLLPHVETTQVGFGILLSECVHADHVACTEVLLQHWKSVCSNEEFVPQESKHRAGEADIPCPAMWSDPAVCRILIDAGAPIETKDEDGLSPLQCACESGVLDVVKMLVEAGAEVCVREYEGPTCLTLAGSIGHIDTVRYLAGLPQVDVNLGNQLNETVLFWAVENSLTADVAQVLIDAGADIDIKNTYGRRPLHNACKSGALDNVKMLVRAGAKVNATDYDGSRCLALASYSGHTETVRYLVGLPEVDVNHRDANLYDTHTGRWAYGCADMIALHCAAQRNRTEVAQLLIDAGADVDIKNRDGDFPVHLACISGALDVVKMLVEAGARVCDTDNEGRMCLHLATQYGHTEIVRYLVGLPEVDVNCQNPWNNTALHCAVEENYADVAQVLIDAGADIEMRNCDGYSPMDCVVDEEQRGVAQLLINAGADMDTENTDGRSP